MLGLENMIMGMMFDGDNVMRWVNRMAGYSAVYARELSSVSGNVCVITDVMSDLMSPEIAARMSMEDRIILSSIKDSFSMIHNCGNTLANVSDIVSMGSDIISLEMSSAPEEYMRRIGGRCKVLGCINATGVMLEGDAAKVRKEALRSAELGVDFVGPECGLPPRTPNENVAALANYRLI
jgi:[methyl-Co(III) methanol-specific corrinoid protein]:coenzyme M methyltransferase